jgi:hypothetical protein
MGTRFMVPQMGHVRTAASRGGRSPAIPQAFRRLDSLLQGRTDVLHQLDAGALGAWIDRLLRRIEGRRSVALADSIAALAPRGAR